VNAGALPVIVIAGIMFYVGLYHLLMYVRRFQQRVDFSLGVAFLAMGCYDIFTAGLYSATTWVEGFEWQRYQVLALSIAMVMFLWFVADYTTLRSRRAIALYTLFVIMTAPLAFLNPGSIAWHQTTAAIKHFLLPLGIPVTYFEVAPGWLIQVQAVVTLAAFAHVFQVIAVYRDSGSAQRARPLLACSILFAAGIGNDMAIMSGWYYSVYLVEYAWLGIALVMAFSETRTVGEAIVMKETLRISEARFRSIYINASAAIGLVAPDGHFIMANHAMCRVFGCDSDRIGEMTIFSRLHPDDAPVAHERHRSMLRGELDVYRGETRYLDDQGVVLWQDLSMASIRRWDGCVDAMTVVMVDITERKQAETDLRLLNEQLEQKVVERTTALREANQKLQDSLMKLREDEEAGKRIQFSLLPDESRTIGSLQFGRYLAPSMSVSGDFVDYFAIDATHTGFYIADVSGHGVSSAFITVMLKSFMAVSQERYAAEGDPTILHPDRLLAQLNSEMLQQKLDKYITLFYGVLDVEQSVLRFSNGGHFPLPILCDRQASQAGRAHSIRGKGAPVGLFDFSHYEVSECTLPETFTLVVFSDGILDMMSQGSLSDKVTHLEEIAYRCGADIPALVREFGIEGHESLPDDVTILAIRRVQAWQTEKSSSTNPTTGSSSV